RQQNRITRRLSPLPHSSGSTNRTIGAFRRVPPIHPADCLGVCLPTLDPSMRILFVGGMYRGYRLAQRLLERGEEVVGAYVFEEDEHERSKYCREIVSVLSAKVDFVQATRRLAIDQLPLVRDRLKPEVVF